MNKNKKSQFSLVKFDLSLLFFNLQIVDRKHGKYFKAKS